MAFTMASVVDPASGVNTPLITQFYEGLFLLGLLAADGHHLLLRALADSFARAPIGHVGIEAGVTHGVLQLFSDMFVAGVTFAAPVLLLLFLTSLLIGLLARAVPSINVLEIGFSLRIIAGLAALLLFAPLIGPALDHVYGALASGLDDMLAVIGS
jgi:flagellar biosynthetic protein FliR